MLRTTSKGLGWVAVLGLLGVALACRAPVSKSAVQVRIRNESRVELRDLTLGAGGKEGGPERYGHVAPGETTDYRPVQPFLSHYRKVAFAMEDGQQHALTVYPEQHLGMRELPAGRYTFALTLAGGKPALRIIAEPRY